MKYLFFGILLGYILGFCFIKNNTLHAPDSKDVIKEIHYDSNQKKYYKYIPKIVICGLNRK